MCVQLSLHTCTPHSLPVPKTCGHLFGSFPLAAAEGHEPSAGDERRSDEALATLAEAAAATETGARDVADANRFGYASFDEHNKRVHVRDVELDHTHYAGRLKPGHAKFVPRSDCYACVPVPRSQYAWQANADNQLIFATDGAEHTCAA